MTNYIKSHLAAMGAEGLAESTVEAREYLLRRLDRELPNGLVKANERELQGWLGNPRWDAKTRETYWMHMVGFFRWVADPDTQDGLDFDPSARLRRPRVGRRLPRVASDAQLALALASLPRPADLAVALAAGVGMRASEVAAAEREHFEGNYVRIHGKGDKQRRVPVPADVWELVAGCPPGHLITYQCEAVTGRWVTRHVSLALDAVGLPRVTLHFFRGSYATRLRRSGADSLVIQRLLGHATLEMTRKYVEMEDGDLVAAVAAMPPLPVGKDGPARTRPVLALSSSA
jgi:integrase